jgi:hypothetical protein
MLQIYCQTKSEILRFVGFITMFYVIYDLFLQKARLLFTISVPVTPFTSFLRDFHTGMGDLSVKIAYSYIFNYAQLFLDTSHWLHPKNGGNPESFANTGK